MLLLHEAPHRLRHVIHVSRAGQMLLLEAGGGNQLSHEMKHHMNLSHSTERICIFFRPPYPLPPPPHHRQKTNNLQDYMREIYHREKIICFES